MEFFATAANIPVHILDSKKGDTTILMLHGYLETMYIWEDMYQELSKDFRVIIADLPGHGLLLRSRQHNGVHCHRMQRYSGIMRS